MTTAMQPPQGLPERIKALAHEITLMRAKEHRIREAIRLRQQSLIRLEASFALSESSRQLTAPNE